LLDMICCYGSVRFFQGAAALYAYFQAGPKQLSNDEKVKMIMDLKAKVPNNIAIQTFDLDYYKSLSPDLQTRFLKCLDSGRDNQLTPHSRLSLTKS
jgi:hypothetical protein